MSNILETYNNIDDIKSMDINDLNVFSAEIRDFLIKKVSKTGGHLASNLGVVELTLALYKAFDFNEDRLIWDVGHQAYVHKILTGRKNDFDSLRQYGGISGFPKRAESKFDRFETGHSSTSISAALGMARARDLKGLDYEVVSVIGDGALTGGMALEALNDVGYRNTKLIIILNDNQMSISKNVGGLSTYLSKFRVAPKYNKAKDEFNKLMNKIPSLGKGVTNSIEKIKDSIKQLMLPGMLFEDMGLKYIGPIDGHNIKELVSVLSQAKLNSGPVIIHVITKKGKGYNFAEKNPNKFHALGPFDLTSGECHESKNTYSNAFGKAMVKIAKERPDLLAITAAMPDGTGLNEFAKIYKKRFFDVGIAEQHAVTLSAGFAAEGLRPVFAVYSTFLQRSYDQIIHDVCMQNLPVIFAIDRAGLVGRDGETHQGLFDISFLSHMPNMVIMAPKCTDEIEYMLRFALNQNYPIAIRYPRGEDNKRVILSPLKEFKLGIWEKLMGSGKLVILATGNMVSRAVLVSEKLSKLGIDAEIYNASFIKPIDTKLLDKLINENKIIVTIEDNVLSGGFGQEVLSYVNGVTAKNILNIGFKDEFITHGSTDILFKLYGLDVEGITEDIRKFYEEKINEQ